MTTDRESPEQPLGRAWARRPPRLPAREPLSRERIVAAALDLVDAEGVEALSMRRLAAELDAGTTSVYWHVGDKDRLLDLVLDAVLGEVALPDGRGPWRDRLAELAADLRAVLSRHRDVARLYALRPAVGPHALGILEYVLATLCAAGLDEAQVPYAYSLLLTHVAGFVQHETTLAAATANPSAGAGDAETGDVETGEGRAGGAPAGEGKAAEGLDATLGAYLATLPPERYPTLVAIAPTLVQAGADERFSFGLARILDGLEAAIAGAPSGPDSTRAAGEDAPTRPPSRTAG